MDSEAKWKEVEPSVTEFADAISDMKVHVERLVAFYREHVQGGRADPSPNDSQGTGEVPMDQGQVPEKRQLSPLVVAKLQLAIAFAMNTCYWTYLVTEGVDPRKHKIAEDFERIKLYIRRARAIEESLESQRPFDGLKKPKFNVQETW